jgi:DNA-binding SARP family transcriptional activator/TolB-like protein
MFRLLGPAQVLAASGEALPLKRKDLALLAYLCLRPDTVASRETVSALLWPDSAEEQARASLRQSLSSIRKTFGPAEIIKSSDASTLRMDLSKTDVDVRKFLEGIGSNEVAALEESVSWHKGELCEGLGPISPEYDRWLDAERGAVQSHYIAGLLKLVDAYEADKRLEDVIANAKKMLSLDPLQEHVHRRLMRAYFLQMRYDAALKQFDNLKDILASQLGVTPEKPSIELMQAIRKERNQSSANSLALDQGGASGDVAAFLVTETPSPPDRPSIGVLRFRGLPEDSDAPLLGEGIAEDLTIELSREADLLVISRQSSFHIDEEKISAQETGRKLGVRYFVSGTVRVFGSKLRVTAHLVSCENGQEVWAERYDRDLVDFFSIQTDIARTVSATVTDRIAANTVEKINSVAPDDLESYQLVLRGISEVHKFAAENYLNAIKLFEEAIARTPKYGRAFGWLALSKIYLRWNIDASIELSDIVPIAERAVALDPNNSKGHCALAMCSFIKREFDKAEFHFQSALRANPNDELLLTEYGRYLMYVDRPEDGLQRIREAMRVNPYFPVWFWSIQGRVLHTLERYDEAVRVFKRVSNPPFYIHVYLAACYAKMSDVDRMEQAKAALYKMRPDFDLESFKAIFPYKNQKTADKLFESFELAGF